MTDLEGRNEEGYETEIQILPKEPPDRVSPTWIDVLPQIISSCVAHTLVLQVGIHMAYSTVQIPHLTLSTEQSSWLAGLVTITNPLGSLCIGPIMDRLGRKWSLLLVCIPFSITAVLSVIAGPSDVGLLYASKIFAGIGSGMSTVAMVYVSEICHGDYRPALLCLNSVFISLGILLTALLNLYLDWNHLSLCFLALVALTGASLLFLAPESPNWLINLDTASEDNQRINKSERSLKYFNPNKKVFESQWRALNQVRIDSKTTDDGKSLLKKILTSKQCYKPLTILLILFSLQQLTGVYGVIFYAMQLFKQVGTGFGSSGYEAIALVYLAIIRLVMSVATTVLARSFGRKPLLIVSAAGICVFSFLLSGNLFIRSSGNACYHLDIHNSTLPLFSEHSNNITAPLISSGNFAQPLHSDSEGIQLLDSSMENVTHVNSSHRHHHKTHNHTASLQSENKTCTSKSQLSSDDNLSLIFILLYVCFSAVGVIVIPWTMIAELLPDFARGTCSGFLISYGYVWMFLMVKFFLAAVEYSVMLTFAFFAVVSGVLGAFVYIYVPETKGKSFVEIQKFFS